MLHREGYISFPLTPAAEGKVGGIIANITGTYFGHEMYRSVAEKAVAHLYFLIKDHPFTDGNKRTASLVFATLCALNDLDPHFGEGNPTLDELAVFIERIQGDEHQQAIRSIAELIFPEDIISG